MVAAASSAADPGPSVVYDAFISYSRADTALASRLAKALEAWQPPKDLAVPQRHLKVFRDEEDFTGVEYYGSVERHLTSSGSLVVICSPSARRSRYVDDEIRRFGAARGADRIVPVLCSGVPNNEAADGREEEWAFPEALCELMQMPLAVNYAGFDAQKDKVDKGAFENSWYTLLANLLGISRSDLEQRDKRRQARARRFRLAVVGAFVVSICVGLLVSLYEWREAVIARDRAFSRELAAHALGQVQPDPDLGVKLALEALRVSPTGEAEAALREGLVANRVLAVMTGTKPVRITSSAGNDLFLLTASSDHVLRLWRVETGEIVAELRGHTDVIDSTAFSADGQRAATASRDGTARIWDLSGKRALRQLAHGKVSVSSARFSPDGRFLATGAGDGTVRVWNTTDGSLIRKIDAHAWRQTVASGMTRVAYSPDGRWLLSSAGDASTANGEPIARMWDAESGMLAREFPFASGVVIASQFSLDGTRVFAATDRSGARVWDSASGELLAGFDEHTGLVRVAALSPDAMSALTADNTAGRSGDVLLWDARNGARRSKLYGVVTAVVFDSAGERVATGNEAGARVWAVRSGELVHDLRGHFGDVISVDFVAGGAALLTASEDGTARVWDLRSAPELVLSGLGGGSLGPEFSRDGNRIVAESATNAMVWDAWRGTTLLTLAKVGHMASITGRTAFDRGNRLMVGDQSVASPEARNLRTQNGRPALSTVHLPEFPWFRDRDESLTLIPRANFSAVIRELGSWRQVSELEGHRGSIGGAVFGPDSTWVLTASEDGTARVWDVASGQQRRQLELDNRGYAVLLSPDGRMAGVVEDWAGIKLWDTATWQGVFTFTWPAPPSGGNWAKVAEFSPDGTLLAVGDNSGVLHLLDVAARKERASVAAHKYKVSTLAFSADGRFIVTTGEGDRGARVWASATGRRLAELGTQPVVGAAFRPDGSQIATLGSDGTLRLFNWQRFAPLEELESIAAARVKRDWTPGERERYFHEQTQH
jgi:WD40 repeat protein